MENNLTKLVTVINSDTDDEYIGKTGTIVSYDDTDMLYYNVTFNGELHDEWFHESELEFVGE